jgi:nitrate/TMAO reductase-like tetraheme cytochrome c subunit
VPYHTKHSGPLEYLRLVAFKTRIGVRDMIAEAGGVISTRALWEQERPRLSREVEQWFKDGRSITCQQCHDLKAFGGDYSEMTKMVHADLLHAQTVNCIKCHKHVSHVYGKEPEAASQTGTGTPALPQR